MRRIVPPEINVTGRRAPLLVGRDPGDEETRAGKPFIGASGQLLFGGYDPVSKRLVQGSVAHAGLTRSDFNITNRVLRQPWNNDFYRHEWTDINDGKRELLRLIDELRPSIIVATGAQAAYDLVPNWATLTDHDPGEYSGGRTIKDAKDVLERRGFLWYPEDHTGLPCPVLVTIHPAACLYQAMPNRLLFDIDFQRLGAVLRGELPRRAWPTAKRVRSASDLAPLWKSKLVAYDIEIKYDKSLLCIAFYSAEGDAFLAYADALGACVEFLESDVPKLCHNGQFDRHYLWEKQGIIVRGRAEDTICGHWACYPELAGKKETGRETQQRKSKSEMTRKGLLFLNSFHLNVPWHKTYTSDPVKMGELCVNDVASTMWNWEVIEPEIDSLGVRKQYERQMAKLPALIAVQKRGFLIDERMRLDRLKTLNERQSLKQQESKLAAESFLKEHRITHQPDGKEYWWYHAAQCECCGGGSKIAAHCHRCAGLEDTKKPTLVMWVWKTTKGDLAAIKKMKVSALIDLLPCCKVCSGKGKTDTWDFNPMSDTQMPALLWDILEVPKYLHGGSPNSREETLKDVLEWAEDR